MPETTPACLMSNLAMREPPLIIDVEVAACIILIYADGQLLYTAYTI